jgi:hypothetical protein
MNNPFEFGRELGTDELVDRAEEVDAVVQTIRQGARLFLVGPRRFDAESYPALDSLVTSLISTAARSLKGPVERVGEQVRGFFSRLRPEMSFNITQDAWSAKLGINIAPTQEAHLTLLVDALNGLEALAAAQPKHRPIALIIDEFQKIIDLGGAAAESQIRAAIQRHKRVGYVFAGSKTRMLTAMTMDASRPFYRLGKVRFIGPVPKADFEAFLRTKYEESGYRIEDEGAIQNILALAEEVPYNVQMLAHACWDELRTRPKQTAVLTPQLVHEAMALIVRQYDPFYTQIWSSLTAIQQKTLLAVIQESGARLQSHRVALSVGRGASTVQRALESLADKEILREEEHEGGVRMRFEDPFLAQWIRAFPARVTGLIIPQIAAVAAKGKTRR